MAGITAYGAYVPVNRLERSQLGGGSGGPGERAVAGFDEDSITMAVAAAQDCLKGLRQADLLYFASTTATYREKQAASLIAGALDAVRGGGATSALVTMADCRMGAPGGSNEAAFGDASAAFVFGSENVLATVRASYSVTADFTGNWRGPADSFVSSWEERFSIGKGFIPLVAEAVAGVLKQAGVTPGDCSLPGSGRTACGCRPRCTSGIPSGWTWRLRSGGRPESPIRRFPSSSTRCATTEARPSWRSP